MPRDFLFLPPPAALNDLQLYDDIVVPRRYTDTERRFKWLFSDIFDHHICNRKNKNIGNVSIQLDDEKRWIPADEITQLFRSKKFDFLVSDTRNEDPNDIKDHQLDRWEELVEIVRPAVSFPYDPAKGFGSNRLSLILGEAGHGKSLLTTKVLDLVRDGDSLGKPRAILVYINLETSWHTEDGGFRDLDKSFWGLLNESLKDACITAGLPAKDIFDAGRQPDGVELGAIASIKNICRLLPRLNSYAVLAVDNIDRFHFSEMRYSFFEDYKWRQLTSIEKNIHQLVRVLSDENVLGHISASVILVCRRAVYDHLRQSFDGSSTNEGLLNGYSVFQLMGPTAQNVIKPRLELLSDLIKALSNDHRLKARGTDIQIFSLAHEILERGITRKEEHQLGDAIPRDVLDLLLALSHQGSRGLVQFLANIGLDCQSNGEVIERLFERQPRNLLRLYLTKGHKRYSQKKNHFPNLYLNDCRVDARVEFPKAHESHLQSYWLKYVILRLVASSPAGRISFGDLRQLLVGPRGYEENFVRLAIGSLSTPNASGCLTVSYSNDVIDSRVLSLSARGKALVLPSDIPKTYDIPFCFQFDYLQLVIDDPWMKYPEKWADAVLPQRVNLDYTLRDGNRYRSGSWEYLQAKMPSVLVLLRILETSWLREEARLLTLPVKKNLDKIRPDFGTISAQILGTYGSVLRHYGPQGMEFHERMKGHWDDLRRDISFSAFWDDLTAFEDGKNVS